MALVGFQEETRPVAASAEMVGLPPLVVEEEGMNTVGVGGNTAVVVVLHIQAVGTVQVMRA